MSYTQAAESIAGQWFKDRHFRK